MRKKRGEKERAEKERKRGERKKERGFVGMGGGGEKDERLIGEGIK